MAASCFYFPVLNLFTATNRTFEMVKFNDRKCKLNSVKVWWLQTW